MAKAYCPNCDGTINVEKPRMGATVNCAECGQELEIISVSPFEVDYPLEADWEDEWDEEEAD